MLNQTCFLQGRVSPILVDCLEGLTGGFHFDVATEFGNEHALGLEVGGNGTLHGFGHVTADTAFFLGQTRAVDFTSSADAGTSDTTNA